MNAPREYVPNHLVWAILATILCCLPLGIVSIVYAARVDGYVAAGDIAAARAASTKALNWAVAAAIIGPLLIALYFVFVVGLGVMGAAFGA